VHLTAASLKGAQVTNSVGLSPTRRSSIGAVNAGAHVSTPPSSVQNRSVMARTAPAAAASHMPVHTMNTTGLSAGRTNNAPANIRVSPGLSARQNQLSQNRPPSATGGLNNHATLNSSTSGASPNRSTNSTRTWEAQGGATDRGRAPQGFGSPNSVPANGAAQGTRMHLADRPPWAGSSSTGSASTSGSRLSSTSYNTNRPSYSNGSRSYEPPSRSYSPPSRTYSAPRSSYPAPRSYSAPSYSAPSRSYSAPSHSYSAPSHSSGGGGSPHGGGGSPHGGGGASHTSHH
jgi:hypothetical protein